MIHREVAERVFVCAVDLFLSVLQHDLDGDVKVFGENVVATQPLQAKVASFETLRNIQQLRDGRNEFRDERGAFVCGDEIGLQRGKGGRVSIDLIHPREGSDVLLHFVEGVIQRVKPNNLRLYASVCTIHVSVLRDVAHPSESFGQSTLSVSHYSPVFVQNVEQYKVVDYGFRLAPIFSPYFPFNHCYKVFDLFDGAFGKKGVKVVSTDEDGFKATFLRNAFVIGPDESRKVRGVRRACNPQLFGDGKHVRCVDFAFF
jgi:hypothetical protein